MHNIHIQGKGGSSSKVASSSSSAAHHRLYEEAEIIRRKIKDAQERKAKNEEKELVGRVRSR